MPSVDGKKPINFDKEFERLGSCKHEYDLIPFYLSRIKVVCAIGFDSEDDEPKPRDIGDSNNGDKLKTKR